LVANDGVGTCGAQLKGGKLGLGGDARVFGWQCVIGDGAKQRFAIGAEIVFFLCGTLAIGAVGFLPALARLGILECARAITHNVVSTLCLTVEEHAIGKRHAKFVPFGFV